MEAVKLEAVTESTAKEFQFKWTIEDFSFACTNNGTYHSSPIFQFEFNGDYVKTRITLYSYAKIDAKLKFLELKDSILLKWEFVLFNSLFEQLAGSAESSAIEYSQGQEIGYRSLMSWEDLVKKISHDDTLILMCNLRTSTGYYKPKITSGPSVSNLRSCIVNDFAKLRLDGAISDMTISVCGKEFRVHKTILAARSPVFASMFKHEMKEAKSGKVEIDDIEPKVFEEFLDFIYKGKADVDQYARQLLPAAEKYNVRDLKAICENILAKNMTEENCIETLVLSDLLSAEKLKKNNNEFHSRERCPNRQK